MVRIHRIDISPPLMNSSSAWASEKEQLKELYDCAFTGAVTTRTATLSGFEENTSIHTVTFAKDTMSSVNSYGYSPHPLSKYLSWVEELLSLGKPKPITISITSASPGELYSMINSIQNLRKRIGDNQGDSSRIAVEINTSCPNIAYAPPPAYNMEALKPLLAVLAQHHSVDSSLTLGLKLPPYVVSTQISDVVHAIEDMCEGKVGSPISFLTCTNTLGSSLLFAEEAINGAAPANSNSPFALPTPLGGLAGESLHAIALGNVYSFSTLLAISHVEAVRNVAIVGVGGVTSPSAARRMHQAGAIVVACATIFGREGIKAFEMLSAQQI